MTVLGHLSWRRIGAILKKELIQLKRDTLTLRMMIGIPIIQLILFGFAINSDPKHLPTAVLTQDHGMMARNIVTGLQNSAYFAITHNIDSEREARTLLQQGKATFVVHIPEHFSRDLFRKDHPQILIEADATDPVAISGALGSVQTIVQRAIERDAKGALAHLKVDRPPYEVLIHRKYNPEGLSLYNIVPGLIGIILTMTGVMMTALSLTREQERGTMENLLSMPVRPLEVMVGKVIPYTIISCIQATIVIVLAYFVFKVPILGHPALLLLSILLFVVCNLSLGFALSAGAQNQMQAMQMSIFLILPSILLSGFMFPFRGMPEWAQVIGSVIPNTYFIRLMRSIMLKGGTLQDIWPHLWPLLLFVLVITAVAMKFYRNTLD